MIELHDIHKHYGTLRANDGISLTIRPGAIHGILGENGAGKSTLMKILAGFITRTGGAMLIDGAAVQDPGPAGAAALGIGMLYQDPMDFPPLSVLENFMAGQAAGAVLDRAGFRARFLTICADLGFDLNPDFLAGHLTVGQRQQLEIVRLLAKGARVLILDEPTTGISNRQKDILFAALRELAHQGRSVLLVSHKIEDVEALCDTVTVLKNGRVTGHMDSPFNTDELVAMMFGVEPKPMFRSSHLPGDEVLRLDRVTAPGGRTGLKDCSVLIRQGEMVGLAGLEGSGQDVFLRVAAGLIKPVRGRVHILGERVTGLDYPALKRRGVAFQPAARLEEGLIRGLTVAEHCALEADGGSIRVRWDRAEASARAKIERFQVAGVPGSLVESLSGGNQQRLLLSFLPPQPRLLLLDHPTRGLDMASAGGVWGLLDDYALYGAAIVFSSSELDDICRIADRVLVFFNGRLIKDARVDEMDALALGAAIAGKV
jgi:simple sugar transport system ATP-binding protein